MLCRLLRLLWWHLEAERLLACSLLRYVRKTIPRVSSDVEAHCFLHSDAYERTSLAAAGAASFHHK